MDQTLQQKLGGGFDVVNENSACRILEKYGLVIID